LAIHRYIRNLSMRKLLVNICCLSFMSNAQNPIEIVAPRLNDFYRDEIVLSSEELGDKKLSDVLNDKLGLYIEKGFLNQKRLKLRGLDAKRVGFFLNDIRLSSVESLDAIDSRSVDRIVLQRTGDHSSGVAGSIRIYTNDYNGGDGIQRSQLSLSAGSFDSRRVKLSTKNQEHLSLDLETESIEGNYSVKRKRTATLYDDQKSSETIRIRNNASRKNQLNMAWQKKRLSLFAVATDHVKGEPGMMGVWSQASKSHLQSFLGGVTLRDLDGVLPSTKLTIDSGVAIRMRRYYDPLGEQNPGPVTKSTHSSDTSLQITNHWQLQAFRPQLSYRIDAHRLNSYEQIIHALTAGIYVPLHSRLALSLSSGLSKTHGYKEQSSDHIALEWQFLDGLSVFSQVSGSYRYPSLEELYFNEGLIRANSDLNSERSRSYELGMSLDLYRFFDLKMRLFRTDLRDYIQYSLVDAFSYRPLNRDQVRSYGLELGNSWRIGSFWELDILHTQQDVRMLGGEYDGRFLPYTPWQHGRIESRFEVKRDHQLGLAYDYAHKRMVSLANTRMLDDYQSFSSWYQLGLRKHRATLKAEVFNLTDRQENMDLRGMPLPGRHGFISVQKSF
jgi:outer membrane cobalamin receptor